MPLEFIDATSLLGPTERIADKIQAYAGAGVTTLSLSLFAGDRESALATLRAAAVAWDKSGVGQ